ncbi:MAG TPA: hypothetical protein VHL80_06815 [Polyangia bacterium]|nr:hypothetical protein [Polyangia bacterium]
MHSNPMPPEEFLGMFFGFAVALFGTVALLRKAQGLPFFQPKVAGVELRENWVSGRSSRGLLAVMSNANNCLWFMVTGDLFKVGTHFPFNLFLPGFMVRFDVDIPLEAITNVEEKSRFLSGKWVRVAYEHADRDGRPKSAWIELRPRTGHALLEVLRGKARDARARAGKSFG